MMVVWGLACALALPPGFVDRQAKAVRVREARAAKSAVIAGLFAEAHVAYPPQRLYLRAFKHERQLEVWVGERREPLRLLKTYPICAASGALGPKRRAGDMQVPEGFYAIDRFNPWSAFHLSLGVSYPNRSDQLLKTAPDPGGDIFIHGNCVTIGCLPIEDDAIEELYLVAIDTYMKDRAIPVHIFPRRLDQAGLEALRLAAGSDATLRRFWQSLVPAYAVFEQTRMVPNVRIDNLGYYQVH